MPGWDEASVDELLADSIVRDLMAADGVDPGQLRTLLYEVQRTIECYATKRGGSTSLAGFARLYSGRSNLRNTRMLFQTIRDCRWRRLDLCSADKSGALPGVEQ